MARSGRAAAATLCAALACACWGDDPEPAVPAEPPAAREAPDTPAPEPPPQQPPAPQPSSESPQPMPGPPPAGPAPSEPAPAPPPGPTLDLDELADRIEKTPAIGVFTKLALKGDIDDLLDALERHHREGRGALDKLRNRFEALTLKIQTLLEPEEPDLAAALARSREDIWGLLADPEAFASLRT